VQAREVLHERREAVAVGVAHCEWWLREWQHERQQIRPGCPSSRWRRVAAAAHMPSWRAPRRCLDG
jgi:hypothetical protein